MNERILLPVLALVLWSCKPSRPPGIISESKFENILVDYHLAQGMSELSGNNPGVDRYKYIQAVFRQHKVTEAQFDSSLVYYSQHAEILTQIYDRVLPRIQASLDAAGGNSAALANEYAHLTSHGDTANIWAMSEFATLVNTPSRNLFSFVIHADTSFYKGDAFLWHFHSQFVSSDHMLDGVAQLILRFANDSTVSTTVHLSGSSNNDLRYEPASSLDTMRLKTVEGFVYMSVSADQKDASRSVLLLTDFSLVRMHKKHKEEIAEEIADSLQTDSSSADSIVSGPSQKDTIPSSETPLPASPTRPAPAASGAVRKPASIPRQ